MTVDLLQMFQAKGSKVKVTAWRNWGKNWLNYQLSRGFVRFRSNLLCRLWSRDTRCTTNFQGQGVNFQGHSVIDQERIAWPSSNMVKIIPESSATR